MAQYLPILAMIVLVVLFVSLSFTASKLLGPRRPTSAKEAPYECGIVPENEPAERFPVKFYLVAIAFIVLDVEIIFLYPFTTVMRSLGTYGLVAMGVFLLVLLVPFGYLLSTGALDWGPARRVTARFYGHVQRATGTPGRDGLAIEPDDTAAHEKVACWGLKASARAAGTLRRSEPGPERPGPQGREREGWSRSPTTS